jgi:hypothetical protein
MKMYWGSGDISTVLNLASLVVSGQLHPQGKSPRYPKHRVGGPQSRCGRGGKETNPFLSATGNRTSVVQPVA